ncbi:hypothetical protein CEXT_424161, partial [Caerostris extrusa]
SKELISVKKSRSGNEIIAGEQLQIGSQMRMRFATTMQTTLYCCMC